MSSEPSCSLPGNSITLRTALWSWVVTLVTLFVFTAVMIPQQNRIFLESLESKARGVAVSLREVAGGSVLENDFSNVAAHCMEMLQGDAGLEYIVVTRNDGLSAIVERSKWRYATNSAFEWRPESRQPASGIRIASPFNRRIFNYAQPLDYSGTEWGWIHVGLSLQSYDRSVKNVYNRTALLAVFCILFSFLGSSFYARRLVRPILDLRRVVQRVAGGDLAARATVGRADELGSLAESVNAMTEALLRRDRILEEAKETLETRVRERTQDLLEEVQAREKAHRELAEAQARLMEASRAAGKAEVATSVLHNVGNILNSVSVSATIVGERLRESKLGCLRRATDMLHGRNGDLASFLTNDVKGRLLPEYLHRLAGQLAADKSETLKEVEQLMQNLEHIKKIVAMQQSYAKVSGALEEVPLTDLVEDALRMKAASFDAHRIVVTRDYAPDLPRLNADRHKILQILINLLSNAQHALLETGQLDKRLLVAVRSAPEGFASIRVRDNGVGIPRENITRIFQHGFTTKKDGHGFGLHSGANAAREIGGRLIAHSDGRGQGAEFILELPLNCKETGIMP